jgi:hypothetical protein
MRGNNIKNSPVKRNKFETPVHYQDMWIGLSGRGGGKSVSISMCGVYVCEQMKTHINFITQLFKKLNNIMHL